MKAAELARDGDEEVRILRRVDVVEGPTGVGDPDAGATGLAIDVETTGLDVGEDVVIELAIRRFRYDEDGRITRHGRLYSWREDPGRSIPPQVSRLTGLSDADVAGCAIDAAFATGLIVEADLVVAHNARFDRPFVERRLEGIKDRLWGCSMAQVDWPAYGFDGAKLGYLLNQVGRFHKPHGAGADVDALLTLLAHPVNRDRTALAVLLDAVWGDAWKVSAVNSSIATKDVLKRRGYHWDPKAKVWWREIDEAGRGTEARWLADNVYGERGRALGHGPRWDRVDRYRRFA